MGQFHTPLYNSSQLAMPLHQTQVLDPLSNLLQHAPTPATNPSTTPSLQTLQTHATNYRWADVLSESSHLLTLDTSPPHETLLLQTYRTLALLQTRQTHRARQSLSALGELTSNPVYTYDHYPQYNKTGSFVPFLLKFLSLDIRFRTGDASAVAAALSMLHEISTSIERVALLSLLTAYALKTGLPDMAVDCATMMTHERGGDIDALLTLSRVHLHLHDLENAERVLQLAESKGCTRGRLAVCKGMIAAGKGEFQTALELYDEAIMEIDVMDGTKGVPGWWICAMNNAAVCLLQLGLLPEAVRRLEDAVCKAPERALQEGLVFNLATVYQLAYPDSVKEKKKTLRRVAERYGRQGFDLEGVGL